MEGVTDQTARTLPAQAYERNAEKVNLMNAFTDLGDTIMNDQSRYIFTARPQRRQLHWEHIETIVEIATKFAALHHVLQISLGGGHHSTRLGGACGYFPEEMPGPVTTKRYPQILSSESGPFRSSLASLDSRAIER